MTGVLDIFGRTADGTDIHRISISSGGLTAKVITFERRDPDFCGSQGTMRRWCLASTRSSPIRSTPFFGASPGAMPTVSATAISRWTARTTRPTGIFSASICCTLAGQRVFPAGFGTSPCTLDFAHADPARPTSGAMGFPGALRWPCTYRLKIPGTLSVELSATTDAPTIWLLFYFNLDDGGAGDILDHRLMLTAAAYLPVDGELFQPASAFRPVDGTPFDFRHARPIGLKQEASKGVVYDPASVCRRRADRCVRPHGCRARHRVSRWRSEQSGAGHPVLCRPQGEHLALADASIGLMPASAWNPKSGRMRRTGPISRRRRCGQGEIYRQVTDYRFRAP